MTPPSAHATGSEPDSLLTLLRRLATDVVALVGNEFGLLRAECSDALSAIARTINSLALAITFCVAGAGALTAAVILVLMKWMPAWFAAALTGFALVGAGAVLVRRARRLLLSDELLLARTRRSLSDDVEVLKGKTP